MGEEEKPLVYAIMWGSKNRTSQKKFVLQVGVIEIFGEIGSVYLPSLSTTTQTLKI
jgi:hypothetical protein